MITVSALSSGRNVPSTRFRIRQHIGPLAEHGIHVREACPAIDKYASPPVTASIVGGVTRAAWAAAKLAVRLPGIASSYRSDVTWLEREILPGRYTLEPLLDSPIVWDVDDAIWLSSTRADRAVSKMARRADVVVAVNDYVATRLSHEARDVRIVPTAIDTDRWTAPKERDENTFCVGWTGLSTNYPYLYQIEEALAAFLYRHDEAFLLVVADKEPHFSSIGADRVRFVRWSPSVEAAAVQEMDVGLMPLPDTEWAKGKGSFKMLQSMSCATPVIVSPVGMNAKILEMGEVGLAANQAADWLEALTTLHSDRALRERMGKAGREVVLDNFSRRVVTDQLARVFQSIV